MSAVGSRGGGFGLDAELARKQAAKRSPQRESACLEWISQVIGEKLDSSAIGDALKNGQALAKLVNKIKPGSVKKIETSSLAFKQMENISNFLRACRSLGVEEYEVFETVDLYEEKDLSVVVDCLFSLSRAIQKTVPEFRGPFLSNLVTHGDSTVFECTKSLESTTLDSPVSSQAGNVPCSLDQKDNVSNTSTGATSSPCGSRGAGYGLDAHVSKIQAGKYDASSEKLAIEWIEAVTGVNPLVPAGSTFASSLKSGEVLCDLANKIKPNSIAKVNNSKMPFKQMENISAFLKACRALGVKEYDLFETVDLFEEKDMTTVLLCIFAFGRAIQSSVPEYNGPKLGYHH